MVDLEESERERINAQSRTQAHGWSSLFNSGLFKADTDPAKWLPFPPKGDGKDSKMSDRTTAIFKRLIAANTITNQSVLAAAMLINNDLIPKDEDI